MAAPKGNDYNKKLKDKKTKDKVYKDYCAHVAKGWSHKSWYYDKEGLLLTWQTLEKYLKEDQDFNPLHKERAVAESLRVWEKRGLKMMEGLYEKCQPAIFQMFMRNKFAWDKETPAKDETKEVFNNWVKDLKSKSRGEA